MVLIKLISAIFHLDAFRSAVENAVKHKYDTYIANNFIIMLLTIFYQSSLILVEQIQNALYQKRHQFGSDDNFIIDMNMNQ